MPNDFTLNLRHLCADRPSVASVCRDIGMNHQQFSKYLSGRARPSPNNLRRISRYFGISEPILTGGHTEFQQHAARKFRTEKERRQDPLIDVFPGDLARLRPHLGAYQVFFRAPGDSTSVIANAAFLDERDGIVFSRIVETLRDTRSATRRWTRCDGKAAYRSGQIFVSDRERGNDAPLSMYILTRPHRDKSGHLYGTMSYLASLSGRIPTSSPVVWKKVKSYVSVREVFEFCGIYAGDSAKIDPKVRAFLSS